MSGFALPNQKISEMNGSRGTDGQTYLFCLNDVRLLLLTYEHEVEWLLLTSSIITTSEVLSVLLTTLSRADKQLHNASHPAVFDKSKVLLGLGK